MPEPSAPEHFYQWNEDMVLRHDPESFHKNSRSIVGWIEGRRRRTVLKLLDCRPGHRVLEVACGTGHVLAQVPAGELYGVDLSRTMIQRARVCLGGRARLVLGNAEQLPFADGSFDRVFCTSVLSHVLHPDRVMDEAYRLLKPGGRFVVSVSHEKAIERGIRIARWLKLDRLILRRRDPNAKDELYASEYHLHHFDLELLRESAKRLPPESRLRRVPCFLYPVHLVALYERR